ncbi:MAG: hypothetical protein Q9227_003567 [Pyrenula ochraceoflavens]
MGEATPLYGTKQSSKTKLRDVSSSATLAFSSQLSSLISQSAGSKSQLPKHHHRTSDIFATHNKGSKKRAAADLAEDEYRPGSNNGKIGAFDSVELHKSKRRMEEKARLYKAMKQGDYMAPDEGQEDRCLVDFDRKWAEHEDKGEDQETPTPSDVSSDEEPVEYVDEFGRQRKGTRAQAAREDRRKRIQTIAAEEEARFSARPKMPSNVMYGDTIQHGAFNPDTEITQKMDNLAKKRDRSATPPEDVHYDASAEVRTKGTGFYNFSKDKATRAQELDALEVERLQTERAKAEKEEKKQARRRELEQRKKELQQQKGKKQADRFLDSLQQGMG